MNEGLLSQRLLLLVSAVFGEVLREELAELLDEFSSAELVGVFSTMLAARDRTSRGDSGGGRGDEEVDMPWKNNRQM